MVAGAFLTIAWVGFLIGYYWAKWPVLVDLRPNELGDMLAGSFSPLAFAWFVITVVAQGRELAEQRQELHDSGDALRQQAKELSRSVEQMAAAFAQREDERRIEFIRDLTRRVLYLMYVIADECKGYVIVRGDDQGDAEDSGTEIFGRSELYLAWSNGDQFDLATAEFQARLSVFADAITSPEYRVTTTYAKGVLVGAHLLAMQARLRDLSRLFVSAPAESKTIFACDGFARLEEPVARAIGGIEALVSSS